MVISKLNLQINNIKLLCEYTKNNVKQMISLKGFIFTDSQFNSLIKNVSHLTQVYIEENSVIIPGAAPSEDTFAVVDFSPITGSKTIKDFKLKNNGIDPEWIPVQKE